MQIFFHQLCRYLYYLSLVVYLYHPEPASGDGAPVGPAEGAEQVKVEPKVEPKEEPKEELEEEPAPKKRRGQAKSQAKVQKPKEEATSTGKLTSKNKR